MTTKKDQKKRPKKPEVTRDHPVNERRKGRGGPSL
jgi:hypothetical protein